MTARPPSKPWRVYGTRSYPDHYRSQRAAYEAVGVITRGGNPAKVYHWESGSWILFERIDPVTTDPDTEG
jgi:hypothetical protein